MAVTGQEAVKLTGLTAAADLSSHQYRFVKLDSDGNVAAISAGTDVPVGVLQNKPDASGKTCEIVAVGVTKLEAGESINEGDAVKPAADGQAATGTRGTDNNIAGQAQTAAGAAAELFTALVSTAI